MEKNNHKEDDMVTEEVKAEEEMQSLPNNESDEKEAEIARLNDQFKRLQADFINYKKNVEKEKERLLEFSQKFLLQEIVQVHFHMENVLNKFRENDGIKNPLYQGIELLIKEIDKVIQRHGLVRKNTIGEEFDPRFHEAIQMKEDSQKPNNSIIEEYSPLYIKNGECYFPAKVLVAENTKEDIKRDS